MNDIAESYVKLVLALGNHDADYVDAYYGPSEWKEAAEGDESTLVEIRDRAATLIEVLEAEPPSVEADELVRLRHRYLVTQLGSLRVRARMLAGERLSFDEESQGLYDTVAPAYTDESFESILEELDPLLPGDGSVAERYRRFREGFVVSRERVAGVFEAAIDACRARTHEFIELPAEESFEVEYVTDKSWGAYNWYRGDFHSLIQVNIELPFHVDRALHLACHEGYPGHHVYNALLEQHLVRDRGWIEFTVYPLFSSQSLIAEGTADYGIQLAFPGLDPATAELYYDVQEKAEELSYAGDEAARRYIDGRLDAAETAAYLQRFVLMTPDRAAQRVRFIDAYRSYTINYNQGRDVVRHAVESRAGDDPAKRWEAFVALLTSPRVPSDLR